MGDFARAVPWGWCRADAGRRTHPKGMRQHFRGCGWRSGADPAPSSTVRSREIAHLGWSGVTPLLAAMIVAVMAGAAIQAATGFGFALLAAPLAFAALEQEEAIGLLLLLGSEIGVLTLLTEGRRPRPMVRRCAIVLLWAVPAAVAGVAVLRALDAVTLQIAVSVGVAATLLVRSRAPAERRDREPRWAAPATGLCAGALVTSTNTSGPPLLLYLLGRGDEPSRVRDTLTVCQLGLSLIGV